MADPKSISEVEYRFLDEFPGYRFGSDGSVWSQRDKAGKGRHAEWRLKKPTRSRYCHVSMYIDGKSVSRGVHCLVLAAFVGPCPDGMQGLHGDGNTHNNSLENLRWGTPLTNAEDRAGHGTTARGSRQGLSKLTETDVVEIRRLWRAGSYRSKAALGRRFGVRAITILNVIAHKTWAHVPEQD